jgi:undecaprenyl-diphosphatase
MSGTPVRNSETPSIRTTPWPLVCAVGAAVFLACALLAAVFGVSAPERAVHGWIVGQLSPAAVALFDAVNLLGDKKVVIPAAAALLLLSWRRPGRWWLPLAAVLAGAAFEDLGKYIIARPRPLSAEAGFPSGHATTAAAFFVPSAALLRPLAPRRLRPALWLAAAACPLLVALGRVAVQAHWPLDALGGLALGLALAAGAAWWNAAHPPASKNATDGP